MRIDDRNAVSGGSTGKTPDVGPTQLAAAAKNSAAYQARLNGDSVELSGVSQSVRHFQAARSARVAQLAKSVQSGSYSVNPALISSSLVGEALAGTKELSR
jgi:anti-sigma28 factor (negative regulator of flagellin synthesis)